MRRLAHCAVAVTLFVVLLLAGLTPVTATAQRRGHYTLLIENDSRYDIYYRLCLAGDGNRSKELGLYNFLGYDITHAWSTSARDRRATNATS